MKRLRASGWLVAVMVLLLVAGIPAAAWSQAAAPGEASAQESTASDVVAGFGSILGSIVYFPFKALMICPGMAIASGVSYAFTGGESEPAEHLLRVGCTGSYGASAGMVQGQGEFLGSGKDSAVRGR
jgi:hypothetical protein